MFSLLVRMAWEEHMEKKRHTTASGEDYLEAILVLRKQKGTPMTSHQSTMQICKFGSSCVSLPGKIVQYQFGSLLPAVTYMRCIALPVQSFYPVFLGRGNTAAAHSFHLDPEAMKTPLGTGRKMSGTPDFTPMALNRPASAFPRFPPFGI